MKSIVPAEMQDTYATYHYSPGMLSGDLLFISGQIGVDENGAVPESPATQARNAFTSMQTVLREAGLDFADVVSITTHHVGSVQSIFDWFPEVKDEFLHDPYPCWTAIGVTELAIPGLVIEISAIARSRT
ncbi:RidA family protein [Mycolicibacterium goodii]|uniref:RidA family protein n=1 Tax=Mycolicibacterium goodii TaxID=134601 RepID=A0ABS6I1A1_MYCGD|nr:RidA family protein [Mycolicibacterium goodii]MBU8841644.1 RidA family protein [Mycolicibacterium goodii]